jgi:hypothetical protein
MADHDDWTPDDDARLRAALASLRADVEAAPMPDVRFVKARGMARRRQRLLTWTAAAAAAAVVVGTVGYSQFGREAAGPLVPATRGGTTSAAPSPTVSDSLDLPGLLPVDSEWQKSLGLPVGSVTVTPVTKGGGVECGDGLGKPTRQETTTQANSPVSGGATYWSLDAKGDQKDKVIALEQGVAKCQAGPGFRVTSELVSDVSVYSYATPDAGSGWFAVASGRAGVVLLQLVDPAFNEVKDGGFTKDEMATLARIAATRLDRYATSAPPSSPSGGTRSAGPEATNEKMPVTGPDPVPSSDLFVAASQWTDPQFAKGAKASAGKGDPQDTTGDMGVFCETKDFLAGFGGRLGEVEVRAGSGDANVIGHQRVRVDQADTGTPEGKAMAKASADAQVTQEQGTLVRGCTESDGKVTVTPGPSDGTYLMTKEVTGEATGKQLQWVGVAPLTTHGAWTTVVFHGTDDGQGFQGTAAQGFAELDRLLALARQK